jgi:DnaD/phage-associated family protein
MSRLLFDSPPLVIDRKLAKLIGLNEAIVLQQINYWIKLNEEMGKKDHFKDGMWWTYNTYSEWIEKNFPFWSESTLIRTIKKLEKLGLIITTDKYNQKKYDNTKWYTVIKNELDKIEGGLNRGFGQEEDVQKASSQNEQRVEKASSQFEEASSQNEQMHLVNLNRPIPETNSEINPEIYHNNKQGKINEIHTHEKGGMESNEVSELIGIFESELGRPLKEMDCDEVGFMYELVGKDLTVEALRRANKNGIRNLGYIRGIVDEFVKKGIRSIDEARKEENDFKKRQDKKNKKFDSKPEEDEPKSNKYEKFYL